MTNEAVKPPRSFRVIGIIALVWNLIGLASYVAQVTLSAEALAGMPDDVRALYESIPSWAMAAFATATTAGVIASILLLVRSGLALPVFVLSLAAVLVQNFHAFFLADSMAVLGASSVVLPALVVAAGIALIVYSRRAKAAGWLR